MKLSAISLFRAKHLRASGFLALMFILLFGSINYINRGASSDQWREMLKSWFDGSQMPSSAPETFRVMRVVDGDTIELENGDKVRYIGVNTPETVKPRAEVECFGHEASNFNKQLVEGKMVRLEKDVSDRDRYGRLLRFVYLEDGTFVNDELARQGYAYASTFPPDVSKADQFKQAQQEARENKRGLWADDTCKGRK